MAERENQGKEREKGANHKEGRPRAQRRESDMTVEAPARRQRQR